MMMSRLKSTVPSLVKRGKSTLMPPHKLAAEPKQLSSILREKANEHETLLKTVASLGLGLTTIITSTKLVNKLTLPYVPEYNPNKERFDQSTYFGRFCHMILSCDPTLLQYSEHDIRKYQAMLQNHEFSKESDATLWEAHRIVKSCVHPDTNEIIPRPFRMSGWVVYNGPICVTMVASNSTAALLFCGWVNQSQNALVNYFNAPLAMEPQTLLKGYVLAVASALTMVSGMSFAMRRFVRPDRAKELMKFTAFPSCVIAAMFNCYSIRKSELTNGIPLYYENGDIAQPQQTSQVAAQKGLYSTMASRAVLPAPTFLIPPLLLNSSFMKNIIAKNPASSLPISTFMIIMCFGLGLPATIAIFPQKGEISTNRLEQHYQNLLHPTSGQPIAKLYYNKGL